MGELTKIAWCHHTFNIVWGCVEVSCECDNCYAREWAKRLGFSVWGKDADRRILSDSYWREPVKWNLAAQKAGERRRVFCSSMADVMEDHPTVASQRERLFPLIEATPWLDWLLLTKRPQNFLKFTPKSWHSMFPRNVWAMTTVGHQDSMWRAEALLNVNAVVRGLSCEPLLGPLALDRVLYTRFETGHGAYPVRKINWVIPGFESGAHARPGDLAWIRSLIVQCKLAATACFVKQLGAEPYTDTVCTCGRNQDGHWKGPAACFACGGRLSLKDRKGGDISEWPEDIRIREFPQVNQ